MFEALIKSGSLDRARPESRDAHRGARARDAPGRTEFARHERRAGGPVRPERGGRTPWCADWSDAQRLAGERETLGLFLSGHPITPYEPDLKFLVSARLVDVGGPKPARGRGRARLVRGKPATVAGLVLEIRRRPNRVTLILDDRSARLEVSLYEETFQQYRDIIVKDAILIVEGCCGSTISSKPGGLQAKTLMDIDRARERFARRLWMRWPEEFDGPHGMNRFEELLKPYLQGPLRGERGGQPRKDYAGRLNLADSWSVRPSRELLDKLIGAGRPRRLVFGVWSAERHSRRGNFFMAMNFLEFEQPIAELEAKIEELKFLGSDASVNISEEVKRLQSKSRALTTQHFPNLSPWQITQLARHPQRPYTLDYVSMIFTDWQELHGDRMYSDDLAIVGGLARLEGAPVMRDRPSEGPRHQGARAAQLRHAEARGLPQGAAADAMAERFRIPVITLIDTPGAYPGIGSEERGQSEAIARNLFEMSHLAAPILSVVIGEGGSGGALAIGVCDRLVMLQFSVYSVISPESCASILWKSTDKKEISADAMGGTAERLKKLGLVDEVLKEPHGAAHRDPQAMAETLKQSMIKHLAELCNQPVTTLLDARQARLRGFGVFRDSLSRDELFGAASLGARAGGASAAGGDRTRRRGERRRGFGCLLARRSRRLAAPRRTRCRCARCTSITACRRAAAALRAAAPRSAGDSISRCRHRGRGRGGAAACRSRRRRARRATRRSQRALAPGRMPADRAPRPGSGRDLLLQLLRGAGLKGLVEHAASAGRSDAGWHLRPLLEVAQRRSAALRRSARASPALEDPMNRDLRFDRVYLRRRLWPLDRGALARCGHGARARTAHTRPRRRKLLDARRGRGLACCATATRSSVPALRALDAGRARQRGAPLAVRARDALPPPAARLHEALRQMFARPMPTICPRSCGARMRCAAIATACFSPRPSRRALCARRNGLGSGSRPVLELGPGLGTLRWVPQPGGLDAGAAAARRCACAARRGGETLKPRRARDAKRPAPVPGAGCPAVDARCAAVLLRGRGA